MYGSSLFRALPLFFFGDWPQLLGPNRNGIYTGSDVKPPTAIAWEMAVGEGFAAPVIADGKLILFHRRNHKEVVEAFEVASGKLVWSFPYETAYRDDFGFDEGPRSAPTVAGGRVFAYGADGVLHALDLKTGKKLWRQDLHENFKVKKGFFGAGSAPLVHNGRVYLNVGAKGMGVAALEAETGKIKWGATNQEASYSSPMMAAFGVVFFTREGIVVCDPESGKVRYQLAWKARSKVSVNAAHPVVDGNLLFVSAQYGVGAIVLDFSTMPPKPLWSGDESLSAHYATPVLIDGHLYGFHGMAQRSQEFRCVEMRTGVVKWAMPLMGAGTATLINGVLFLIRDDGQIFQIRPSAEKLDVMGNYKVLDGKIRAYPAVGEGLICLRNTKMLACLR